MPVQKNYGNLVVRSFVADTTGVETQNLTAGSSSSTRHIVEIENWTTIPYDIEVEVELPMGQRRLRFDGPSDHWKAIVWSLAKDETDQDAHGIAATGSSTGTERVHCNVVRWKKARRHNWSYAKASDLPLSLTVTVT